MWIASITRPAIVRDGSGPRWTPEAAGFFTIDSRGHADVGVEAHVAVLLDPGADAVVPGEQRRDEPALDHLGGERVGKVEVADRLRLAQHRADLAAVVAAEVAPHPLAQVGRLADVEDLVAVAAEHVDARASAGRSDVILSFAAWGWPASLASANRSSSPSTPSALARSMSRWSRSVVASASSSARWLGRWSRRKREASVPSRQSGTSSRTSRRASATVSMLGFVSGVRPVRSNRVTKEGEVEADVVADDHRVADELLQRREHRADPRRLVDDGVGQAGEHGDLRRDRPAGVDQRLEGAEELAAADLDGADLGDLVVVAVAAGGLEVEDAERDIAQRGAELVERTLHAM